MAKSAKKAGKPKPNPAAAADSPPAKGSKPAKAPRDPAEKAIKVKTRGPFVVNQREEEYEYVSRETCSCGGGFEVEMEEVRAATEAQGPLDVLKTLCMECGSHVDFLFDISSFYDGGVEGFEAEAGNGADGEGDGDDDEGGWL